MKKNATTPQSSGIQQGKCANYSLPKNKTTLRAKVLAYLLQGNSLTHIEGLALFHTIQLPAVIYDLRHNYGLDVLTELLAHTTTDGRQVSIARYSLPHSPFTPAEIAAFCAEVKL